MIRSAELQGKRLKSADGRRLGRVHEIHIRDGEVIALTCGAASLLQRFVNSERGRRVPWPEVAEVTDRAIILR
jgi:sporulation protein YlmC with PRC-barrel domain